MGRKQVHPKQPNRAGIETRVQLMACLHARKSIGLRELARRSSMPVSTVEYQVRRMVHFGMVEKTADGLRRALVREK